MRIVKYKLFQNSAVLFILQIKPYFEAIHFTIHSIGKIAAAWRSSVVSIFHLKNHTLCTLKLLNK